MSKKKLLLEQDTVRRFIKLANIPSISDDIRTALTEEEGDELGFPEDPPAEDLGLDAELPPEEGEGLGEDEEDVAARVVKAATDGIEEEFPGLEIEVTRGEDEPLDDLPAEEEPAPEDLDAGPEPEPELEPPAGRDGGMYEGLTVDELLEAANVSVVDEEALVNEITKRVVKRLVTSK